MVDLFFLGFLIGAIVAAPIGPIGTATLVEATAGNCSAALSAMAGCICAELGLLLIAVFSVVHFNGSILKLPGFVHLSVGLAIATVGIYYLAVERIPSFGRVTTFLIAFKITLFNPSNISALVGLIVAMGLASKLNSFSNDVAFAAGEFVGVVVCWLGLLGIAWYLRRITMGRDAVPWLRRCVGVVMFAIGLTIVMAEL